MHVPKSLLGACIACVLHLRVCRHPNCTSINHFNMQMLQSAQEMTPCTQTIELDACNSLGARIFQNLRCTCQARTCPGAPISCPPVMHTYSKIHAPLGVGHVCCC